METVASQGDVEGKLHDVSNFHMGWINERNALEERCSKMQADSNNYLNMMDRLQGELEACKRELTAVGEKERQTRVKNKHLASRLKQEEDEVKRLTLMMEHKQDHFNHDIRKKERETLQLKERLSKKIMEKKTEKGTQQVLNTMPRTTTGRRAQWGDDPREELYKQLVEEQEERNKELFEENDHLRHCLASLETELINVLNSGDKEESFLEEADLDPKIISHINMPYTVVQNTFKSSIDDKIELIKEKHRRMASNKEAEEELAALRKTIDTQQLTITEQMVTLEDCTCKEERQNYSDAHDAELESRFQQLMEETERIEKSREDLRKEKEDLRVLENKIKDDHKRFREERTQLFESNLLATPNIQSIKRENNHRQEIRTESPITVTEVARPGLREGHLYFSPAPSESTTHLTTPPPTQNTHIASTDEFNRELSRLDLSNLHGKILNEFNYYFGRIRTIFSRSNRSSDLDELTSTPRKLRNSDKTRLSRSHGNLFSCLSPQNEPETSRSKSLNYLGTLSNINTALRSDSLLKFTTASESISVIGPVMSDDDVTSRACDVTSRDCDVTSPEELSELTLAEYLSSVS